MPYENVPTENAPALAPRADEYAFTIDLTGTLPDGSPRATIDDLDMFDAETRTGNKQMLDFLDRVVTSVTFRGTPLMTRIVTKESYEEGGETKEREHVEERAEGVRGKGIGYVALKKLFAAVGEAMKDASNAKN
jgi:hypothetical protein